MVPVISTLNNSGEKNDNSLKFSDLKGQFSNKYEELIENVLSIISAVVGTLACGGNIPVPLVYVIQNLVVYLLNQASFKKPMSTGNLEEKIIKAFHCLLETDVKSLERNLKFINDQELPTKSKEHYLRIADNTCFKLLQNFRNDEFYLKKNPLAFTPFLAAFVAVYVPIALGCYRIAPMKLSREDLAENMRQLEDTVRYFRDEVIKERLSHIHVSSLNKRVWVWDTFLENGCTHFFAYDIFVGWIPFPLNSEEELVSYRANSVEKHEKYFDEILKVFKIIEL